MFSLVLKLGKSWKSWNSYRWVLPVKTQSFHPKQTQPWTIISPSNRSSQNKDNTSQHIRGIIPRSFLCPASLQLLALLFRFSTIFSRTLGSRFARCHASFHGLNPQQNGLGARRGKRLVWGATMWSIWYIQGRLNFQKVCKGSVLTQYLDMIWLPFHNEPMHTPCHHISCQDLVSWRTVIIILFD